MTKLKVLVVEDDPLVRLSTAELLDDAGFEVVAARNAQEALTKLQDENGIRVLFTDVDMPPGDNGLELARKVQRTWPEVGLVITSGHSLSPEADLPDSGRFVAKAVRPEVLLKVIEQAAQPR